VKDARKYIEKYKRADIAIDAFYGDGGIASSSTPPKRVDTASMTQRLTTLFEQYKENDGDDIAIDGTIKLCEDLSVDPEDVVLLAIAYELKSPRIGEWNRKGWMDGWKALGCDSISSMRDIVPKLRDKMSSDPAYYKKIYNYTFEFAKAQGQRSVATESAIEFWNLLLPHGLKGKALSHVNSVSAGSDGEYDDDDDVDMDDSNEAGWNSEYTAWWFEYLTTKGVKGVSKDTWTMFLEFVRIIDSKFEKYDLEAAWPSSIDDFVDFAKGKLAEGN